MSNYDDGLDSLFSKRYQDFILPPADVLEKERYVASLSETEKELYFIRQDLFNGKVRRLADMKDDSHTCYEDAISCVLFWALEDNKITEEERDRLYQKYK